MTETNTEAANPTTATPKAKKGKAAAGAKKPKTAPSHPAVSQMVVAAIKSLKERGGSSTQAIKKYISSTYKIDAEKKSHFIKKYLVSAVASGSLVQTKGKGASGSFKLAGPGGEGKKTSVTKKLSAKPAASTKSKASKVKTPAKKTTAAPKSKKTKKPPTAAKTPKPKVAKAKPALTPKAKKTPAKKAVSKKQVSKKASPKKK